MSEKYKETIYKLRKLEKENDALIDKFEGENKKIAIETKAMISRQILMFQELEEKFK